MKLTDPLNQPSELNQDCSNRRKEERLFRTDAWPAKFVFQDSNWVATVIDVSTQGLGLFLKAVPQDFLLPSQTSLKLVITMPEEEVIKQGTVAWSGRQGEDLYFGVSFDDPKAKSDQKEELLDISLVKIDPVWALCLPSSLVVKHQILPFAEVGGLVHVAYSKELQPAVRQAVHRYIKNEVRFEKAEAKSLKLAISRVFSDDSGISRDDREEDDAVSLCQEILYAAVLRQASDVHIDPDAEGVRIRFRVDGQLEDYRRLAPSTHASLLSRLKVLSGMDISEKRSPQDGRFTHKYGSQNHQLNIRTATLPTKLGERMTLRLLAMETESLTYQYLGMSPRDSQVYEDCLEKPHGLMLITGPTGSGKTTTLYAAIRRLLELKDLNIVTIEDPVEYSIPGVAQVEVDSADKVSFSKALRSVLRHDPDVVMIGEIRDKETASIAMKAALTGHLVLSTLHTNSAAGVVTRLLDMGVESFLIAATLRLAAAQRLVRRLCRHCRKPRALLEAEAAILHRPDLAGQLVYEPEGCAYCTNRGYAGRLSVFEMLPVDQQWSRDIAQSADETRLMNLMKERGIPSLLDDAVDKLLAGDTSFSEVVATVTSW